MDDPLWVGEKKIGTLLLISLNPSFDGRPTLGLQAAAEPIVGDSVLIPLLLDDLLWVFFLCFFFASVMVLIPLLLDDLLWAVHFFTDNLMVYGLNPSFAG